MLLPAELIKKTRNKIKLSKEEIYFLISSYTSGSLPDYQMSAWLMAVFFNRLSTEETHHLTQAMLHSGAVVDLSSVQGIKVDKHSTGGVGDKTSLILGAIVAAAGIPVPMISGRGLGHTGGTLDKLESIPGFNTQLDLVTFEKQIKEIGVCFIGQTKEICPADKKIYALRDVTATIESFPLICASIMSKKLAEGIDALVLDVKCGNGAFMKTPELAEELALNLIKIGQASGKKVSALITNMDQTLGAFVGNALEVRECLEIMGGKTKRSATGQNLYEDTTELSLWLSAHMICLGGKSPSPEKGYALAKELLQSGEALKKFTQLCEAQGGDLSRLPKPKPLKQILSENSGYIESFNTESIGVAAIHLRAGRAQVSDTVDPSTGIEVHKKIGDLVEKNEPIFTIFAESSAAIKPCEKLLQSSFTVSAHKPAIKPLILKTFL